MLLGSGVNETAHRVLLDQEANAKTCASLMLECARERASWQGGVPLLHGIRVRVARRKPERVLTAAFDAAALMA